MGTRRGLTFITLAAALAMAATSGRAASPMVVHAAAAPFTVGAAVRSYTPYCGPNGSAAANHCTPAPAGFVDPADCGGALDSTVYTGSRLFAFEEPYVDQKATGHYDLGDPYLDCNADGRWDGNFIGGGGNAPRFYTQVADPVGARAMVVGNGTRTIAVEVLDNEGAFNVYLQAIRTMVGQLLPAGAALHPNDVFISSTHDESAPDTIGLYGVSSATSSANNYFVPFMEAQAAAAIVSAYNAMQPATITYGEAIEPATFRQCFSSYPFVDDQLVPTLQAVNATTHKVIVTLGDVSQHAETLGFNGGSAADPNAPSPTTLQQETTWLSADWPYWFRHQLETDYGGVAIEMAGSVGSNETPQVFPTAVSRTPQQFVDASHPAGCRTEFTANQASAVKLGYYTEDVALGNQLAAAVHSALSAGTASTGNDIAGARASVCILVTNALFDVGGLAGVFAERPGYADPGCTQPLPVPPTGNVTATYIQSDVAAFRVGDGTFVSIPGEVFPFTFLRSFLGPQDMPCPDPNSSGACGGPPSPALELRIRQPVRAASLADAAHAHDVPVHRRARRGHGRVHLPVRQRRRRARRVPAEQPQRQRHRSFRLRALRRLGVGELGRRQRHRLCCRSPARQPRRGRAVPGGHRAGALRPSRWRAVTRPAGRSAVDRVHREHHVHRHRPGHRGQARGRLRGHPRGVDVALGQPADRSRPQHPRMDRHQRPASLARRLRGPHAAGHRARGTPGRAAACRGGRGAAV